MTISEDLEAQLKAYLAEQRKADVAATMHRILDRLIQHEADDLERHNALVLEVRGVSARVGVIEHATRALEKDVEDTGSYRIADLEKQLHAAVESRTWMQRNWLPMVATVIGIIATITSLVLAVIAITKGK